MLRPRLKRLLRVSLRMVFLLTTIFCFWLGFKVQQVKQQREAVAWVEKVGGAVRYDYEYSDFDRQFLYPAPDLPGPNWVSNVLGGDFFATVVDVELVDAEVDDLSHLEAPYNLKSLFLERTRIGDVESLASLTSLRILMLREMQVKDLSVLIGLANLKELWLESVPVDDLSPLTKLTHLETLVLDMPIAEEQFQQLKGSLPACEILAGGGTY